jgi:hypothetical protein
MFTAIGPNLFPLSPKIPVKPGYVLKFSGTNAGPFAAVPMTPAGTLVDVLVGAAELSITVIVTPG